MTAMVMLLDTSSIAIVDKSSGPPKRTFGENSGYTAVMSFVIPLFIFIGSLLLLMTALHAGLLNFS